MLKHNLLSEKVSPDNIFLDIYNPRFLGETNAPKFHSDTMVSDSKAQEQVRRYLVEKQGAKDLIESIARVGFLKVDRIIVREISSDNYVVIEGNRRLAAIKTILWDIRRKVVCVPVEILSTFSEIEVLCLADEGEDFERTALFLQGVRHISGVRNWGPYQQGRLISALVEDDGLNFSEAALSVGLSSSRVSTLLRGFCGLRQMQGDKSFGNYSNASFFSHFEQAYLKIPVRNWLGWCDDKIGYSNLAALHFFYQKIIGVDGVALRSRDIRDLLPIVLEHENATAAYLNGEVNIQQAFAIAQPQNEYLESFIQSAKSLMIQAQRDSHFEISAKERVLLEQVYSLTGKILQQPAVC